MQIRTIKPVPAGIWINRLIYPWRKGKCMGFKCGLTGLPNAGKSTIFNALTRLDVEASAYPFCTIDPHFGIVPLEDERLITVERVAGSSKRTYTNLEFVDIAGLVRGASKGEGLGNQFLSHLGRVDAIAHVIRCFEDTNISHPYESLDPVRDAQIVMFELILKDLEIVEKRLTKMKNIAKSGNITVVKTVEFLQRMLDHLSSEKEIRSLPHDPFSSSLIDEMNLLTAKPVIFIANVDENHLHDSPLVDALSEYAVRQSGPCIPFCGKVQSEIAELDQKDQLEFLRAMGLEQTGLQKLVRAGYDILRLITFFTANENEAHAWTIPEGTNVKKAAGKVHTDFETGFIKAEVIQYSDLEEEPSLKALHNRGLVHVHGKEYIVNDGDLILFRIR